MFLERNMKIILKLSLLPFLIWRFADFTEKAKFKSVLPVADKTKAQDSEGSRNAVFLI